MKRYKSLIIPLHTLLLGSLHGPYQYIFFPSAPLTTSLFFLYCYMFFLSLFAGHFRTFRRSTLYFNNTNIYLFTQKQIELQQVHAFSEGAKLFSKYFMQYIGADRKCCVCCLKLKCKIRSTSSFYSLIVLVNGRRNPKTLPIHLNNTAFLKH